MNQEEHDNLNIYFYLHILDMLSRMKTGSSESLKGEVYFRIVPQTIKSISSANAADNLTSQWLLYLEKGMQILGKTVTFEVASPGGQYRFNPNDNKFDFQIASEKNFTYTWSLYAVDQEGYEERMAVESFNIKQYYSKYQNTQVRNGFDLETTLRSSLVLSFKLFIQNTATNIVGLANGIVPESQQQVAKVLAGLTKKPTKDKESASANQNPFVSMIEKNEKPKPDNEKQKQKAKQQQKQPAKLKQPEQKSPQKVKNDDEEEIVASKDVISISIVEKKQPEKKQADAHQSSLNKKKLTLSQIPRDKKLAPDGSTLRIEQQQEEESMISDGKRSDAKIPSSINVGAQELIPLSQITEEGQKQDALSPKAQQSKFRTPGSLNEAIAKQVQKVEEKIEETAGEPVKAQRGQQQNIATQTAQVKEEKEKKRIKLTPKPKQIQPEPIIPESGSKFKKGVIVFLILVLIAGIAGSLFGNKTINDEEDDQGLRNRKKLKKPTKSK